MRRLHAAAAIGAKLPISSSVNLVKGSIIVVLKITHTFAFIF